MRTTWRKSIYEFIRCARHNLLHLKLFRVRFTDNLWYVRAGGIELKFDYYPYLAFRDIEGYLQDGKLKLALGMVVIDAGGCDGEFALYASKCIGPTGRVLMLEPDPKNVLIARRIFALNGNPSNIEILPAGLWNSRGILQFASGQSQQSALVLGGSNENSSSDVDVMQIHTVSLLDVVGDFHLNRLDFVKMDIEGAEIEACEPVASLPATHRPTFAIASYHVRDGQPTHHRLEKFFSKLGYRALTGNERHMTTWATP